MIDNEIVGMCWIRVDPEKYSIRKHSEKVSNA